MIKLDGVEFYENTIIDIVVKPETPISKIIDQMTSSVNFRIILDTQGNLYRDYGRYSIAEDNKREHCENSSVENDWVENGELSSNLSLDSIVTPGSTAGINEYAEISNSFESFKTQNDSVQNTYITTDNEVINYRNAELNNYKTIELNNYKNMSLDLNNKCQEDDEYHHNISLNDNALFDNHLSSTLDHIDILSQDQNDLDKIRTEYYFISGFNSLIKILIDLRKYNGFTLVLDSITFVADCSPQNIQYIINLLWELIYESNATVVTVNHYLIGKNDKLIPRMGARWAFFISYQVLFSSRNNEIIFEINKNMCK